jgi:two-component system NtrC family sensor kinase
MKCPRCQQDNSTDADFCRKCGTPVTGGPSYADLQRTLSEAFEQQTATSEILRVISSSPTDLQPALDAIVRMAAQLCEAHNGAIFRFDGEAFQLAAAYNVSPEFQVHLETSPIRPGQGSPLRRVGEARRPVFVADVLADPELGPARAYYQAEGMRTALAVPMLKEHALVGAITIHRREVRPFTDKQIELVTTFASQAVIAIENVRLFTDLQASNRELTTALDQQTATSDILKVISRSPTDEKPVFQAIADSSVRLCAASFAVVATFDGETLHLVAHKHVTAEGDRALAATYPMRPNRGQMAGRAILERRVVHVADVTVDHGYVGASLGNRATLSVPLLRNGVPIGTITIARLEPLPFTEQQVELLKTFADRP